MAVYNPNITGRALKQTAASLADEVLRLKERIAQFSDCVGAISYPDQVALFEADVVGTGVDFAEKLGGIRTELNTMASGMGTTTYCNLFRDIFY